MASGEAEPLKYQTWVLKVLIHCNGCTREVRKVLQSIDGVYRTVVDSQQHKVTVVGDVAVDVLIKKLVKIGKRAEVWPEKSQPNKEKGKKKEKEDKKGNNQTDEEEKKDASGKEEKLKQPEEKKEKKKDASANGKEAKPKQKPEEKKEKKNEASDNKKKASGKEPNPAGDEAEKNSGGEDASSQQQKQRQQYQKHQEVWEQFTAPAFLPPPVLVTSYNVAHPSSASYWSYNSPIPMTSPAPEVLLPFHQPMPKFFYDYYQQTPHCCAKSGGVCGGFHCEPIDDENDAACRVM